MNETPPPLRPRRNILALVLTTLIGVAATVGVGWYQLSRAEKEAVLAEQERTKGVRQSLVSIVEEHILSGKSISLVQLTRLLDQRRREERVTIPISLSDIIEQVEFNILNTRYLPLDRKESLKPAFEALYRELGSRAFSAYPPETRNADLLNELARQIQDGKSTQALETLKRLQESQIKDLQTAGTDRRVGSVRDVFRQLFERPTLLLGLSIYLIIVFALFQRRRDIFERLRRVFEVTSDRDGTSTSSERREEALKLFEGLTPDARALAMAVSRHHITPGQYEALAAGPMAKALGELRAAKILVPVAAVDKEGNETAAFYYPPRLARWLRLVRPLVPTPPAGLREAAQTELRRVGYFNRE